MTRAWKIPALFALCGIALGAIVLAEGSPAFAAAVFVTFLLLGAVNSPLVFPHGISAAAAERSAATDQRPIIYFRPGCQFCVRLRLSLGGRGNQVHWVNIWRDPAAAAAVRAVNDGNETVPTVVVDGQAHTNPAPGWVKEKLTVG